VTGAVDVSPFSALRLTDAQREDLWARASTAGVLVTISALAPDRYLAAIAGQGRRGSTTADNPYEAGMKALRMAEST